MTEYKVYSCRVLEETLVSRPYLDFVSHHDVLHGFSLLWSWALLAQAATVSTNWLLL